jgi:hypothetical protein
MVGKNQDKLMAYCPEHVYACVHAAFLSFQNIYLLAQKGMIDQELPDSLTIKIGGINQ